MLKAWVLILGIGLAFSAEARVKRIDEGDVPNLNADEGVLAIVVDTNNSLVDVRFKKDGRLFDAGTIKSLQPGATTRLYVVPAGVYQWDQVTFWIGGRYKFKDIPETKFEVLPGRINYPGDLIVRAVNLFSPEFQFSNRGLQIMDWMGEVHSKLLEKYEFAYSGHYPDPFPAFYRSERANIGKPATELMQAILPPKAGNLPFDIRELWRAGRLVDADMNPRGNLVVKVVNESDGFHFKLIDVATGIVTDLFKTPLPLEDMAWSGDSVLVATTKQPGSAYLQLHVVRVGTADQGRYAFEYIKRSKLGIYVEALPEDPDHVLYASNGDRGRLMIHRVGIKSQAVLDRFEPLWGTRINRGIENDRRWFADGTGRLRAALARSGDDMVLLHGMGESFQEVLRFGLGQAFDPLVLSFDGSLIYGLSDDGRNQRDLVVFDPAQKRIVSTLFSKPGVDTVAPILDAARTPIGALYHQGGHAVSEYFDTQSTVNALLPILFPDQSVAAFDRARNGSLLVWVGSSTIPGRVYHVDVAQRHSMLIEEPKPWLKSKAFAGTRALSVLAPDGAIIEAYYTHPISAEKAPLIVLSHGGPVGVRDERSFDPEVQFLASLGYAVLQVNFRGSDGFGKAFREAGKRSFGRSMEDDIDAVLKQVLAYPDIDSDHVCAVGASYGGYSAIVSSLRWPLRFKCIVSISGVTDWLLFFTASDGGNTTKGRAVLENYIGDPITQAATMMESSPIYRYKELKTPLMLVHGAEDGRVDYEHTRRIVRMLNIAGIRPVLITLPEEEHSIESLDSIEKTWSGIAGFLRKYLGPGVPFEDRNSDSAAVTESDSKIGHSAP